MNRELAERHPPELKPSCVHRWVELGADAVYCWRRQCELCDKVEGQKHTMVYAYTVVGCCSHPYVCEGCGYIPQ